MAKFNLLEGPWIPVLREGQVVEVSLGEALLRAEGIQRLETPSPLEEAALHRLLLTLLHRALGGPKDLDQALDWLEEGFPLEPVQAYLDRYHSRFYLFHEKAPFFQIPDLPEKDPLPWTKLLPERASGNNPTLFDHSTEDRVPPLSYAEAARALLVHQAFTPGGLLKRLGVTSAKGAPLAGAACFLAVGKTLRETLLLNLVAYEPQGDEALWERPPLRTQDVEGERTVWPLTGVARVYTWPSRGVRLLDEGQGVRYMAYGPGVRPEEVAFRDPMVAYRQGKNQFLPLRLSVERSFWRDFGALLPGAGGVWPATLGWASDLEREGGLRGQLRVLGQVADQAKILDVRREVYPLPPGLLDPRAQEDLDFALKRAEKVGEALRGLAYRLAREVLGEKDPKELEAFTRSLPLERLYWHGLDRAFPGFLEQTGQKGAREAWKEALEKAVLESWRATRVFVGTQGRHLKALARGEGILAGILQEVRA
ncbi:CRISPR-associated protein CasA/Cse1 [Thermus composti]|uniref:Type I-E CRISPR-associated protein Cse1/CasA n=1 Tax=Thermus composti TaxID=532059 RepID=A0ABV6PZX9_9DEIN|nr:type I-E CRISPR-associated protein Cse1/CasA [Thermus composti]GGN01939.1 CRISPR-associated protein CasA/Cse1 [Thermus composti]